MSAHPSQTSWRQQLADAVRDLHRLGERVTLPATAKGAVDDFPLRVTHDFLAAVDPNDPNDPLLRQIVPSREEAQTTPGFDHDPTGDRNAAIAPGVLHKYRGRALLVVTGACAIHCRYCFRRHYPYAERGLERHRLQQALSALAADPTLHEVIYSGGDPLLLDNDAVQQLTDAVLAIPHIKRLRLHTRLPLVLPARIDQGLLNWIVGLPVPLVVVIHCNHPNELGGTAEAALRRLAEAGATLLNQSVLLRGVNDDADTLQRLSERLFACRVLPYYLHQLDRVAGAAHFEVDDQRALELLREMRERLPGYLLPRLVREIAGQPFKVPL